MHACQNKTGACKFEMHACGNETPVSDFKTGVSGKFSAVRASEKQKERIVSFDQTKRFALENPGFARFNRRKRRSTV